MLPSAVIIINLVNSSSSFRSSDGTWTPLCLPLYSPDANVFAYICFLSKYGAPDVCMVLITSKDDEFFNRASPNSQHRFFLGSQNLACAVCPEMKCHLSPASLACAESRPDVCAFEHRNGSVEQQALCCEPAPGVFSPRTDSIRPSQDLLFYW